MPTLKITARPGDGFTPRDLTAAMHAVAATAQKASPAGLHEMDVDELERLDGLAVAQKILASLLRDRVTVGR